MRYSNEMRFGTDILYLDNDTIMRDGPITIPKTSPQQLKASMILWLVENPIWADVFDTIQPKVFALARQLDDAIDECYNNKMLGKAIM